MQITKMLNGHEYTFEVPENQCIGQKLSRQYDGYKLTEKTEGYHTQIFKTDTSYFSQKETKLIGTLVYNPEKEIVTLFKKVDLSKHYFLKSNSFGINNEIIKNLRTSDRIFITDGTNNYIISVGKAMKVGEYLHFDKFELQLFIPCQEFKMSKCKK